MAEFDEREQETDELEAPVSAKAAGNCYSLNPTVTTPVLDSTPTQFNEEAKRLSATWSGSEK